MIYGVMGLLLVSKLAFDVHKRSKPALAEYF